MCGEQAIVPTSGIFFIGSPPRVRGTAAPPAVQHLTQRITPACAGNSWLVALTPAFTQDHPRVCGEQKAVIYEPGTLKGSPPRVRGTDIKRKAVVEIDGITPACAGNSSQYLQIRSML